LRLLNPSYLLGVKHSRIGKQTKRSPNKAEKSVEKR